MYFKPVLYASVRKKSRNREDMRLFEIKRRNYTCSEMGRENRRLEAEWDRVGE